MISVQLDVFSGRPNPRWTLSPRQTRELVERIQADPRVLLPRDAETVGLGGLVLLYRGLAGGSMSIVAPTRGRPSPCTRIVVFVR